MKVAWLNDFTLEEFQGGANITNSIMIKKGRELGHEIRELTPKDFEDRFVRTDEVHGNVYEVNTLDLSYFDLVILNNINSFKPELINYIISTKKFIKYEHDYSFCQFRNVKCSTCKSKCTPAKIFFDIYSNSLLNIFLSPLHLKIHKQFFKETMRDAIYIPSPLEENKFVPDKNIIRKEAYLYAGVIMEHKGVRQIIDFADSQKNKIFHFAGKAINEKLIDRIKLKHTYLGEVPYSDMPNLLHKYSHFVINPQWDEPFGRNVVEAIVAGCSIIKFSKSFKTGMESYNLSPTQMIERCIKAPEVFWQKISVVCKK